MRILVIYTSRRSRRGEPVYGAVTRKRGLAEIDLYDLLARRRITRCVYVTHAGFVLRDGYTRLAAVYSVASDSLR